MRNLAEHLFSPDQVGEEGKKYQGKNTWAKTTRQLFGTQITTQVQKCLYSTPNSTLFLCPMVVLPDQNDQVKSMASNTRQF